VLTGTTTVLLLAIEVRALPIIHWEAVGKLRNIFQNISIAHDYSTSLLYFLYLPFIAGLFPDPKVGLSRILL
jgi:hypothetical protein